MHLPYEQRVADAVKRATDEPGRALEQLQQIAAGQPDRPDAYEAMAGIQYRRQAFTEARAHFAAALARGGRATFAVTHDHGGGYDSTGWKSACSGELTIRSNGVGFDTPEAAHRFTAGRSEIREAAANRMVGLNFGGFHITLKADKGDRNLNLAPKTRDKAESKLILDLIASSLR